MAGVCRPNPIFVKEVLLEHSQCQLIYRWVCACFPDAMAELSSCDRNCVALETSDIHSLALTNKACQSQPLLYLHHCSVVT